MHFIEDLLSRVHALFASDSVYSASIGHLMMVDANLVLGDYNLEISGELDCENEDCPATFGGTDEIPFFKVETGQMCERPDFDDTTVGAAAVRVSYERSSFSS